MPAPRLTPTLLSPQAYIAPPVSTPDDSNDERRDTLEAAVRPIGPDEETPRKHRRVEIQREI